MGNEIVVETKSLAVELKESHIIIQYDDFAIYEGDFVLVHGKNGAGKSTFFNLFQNSMFNYFSKSQGELYYYEDGKAVKVFSCSEREKEHLRRKIVIIDQKDDYEKYDSGYDVLVNKSKTAIKNEFDKNKEAQKSLLCKMKSRAEELFNEYLKDDFCCDFKEFKFRRVSSWSGGQIKMIHILSGVLKAELMGARLLLMDEPLNNLDKEYKLKVNELLKGLMAGKIAIMVITHCHVFEGINKGMTYVKETDKSYKAKISETTPRPNLECLSQLREEME